MHALALDFDEVVSACKVEREELIPILLDLLRLAELMDMHDQ